MRALALNAFDGPAAVSLLDLPDPFATADGVVVAVEAAGFGTWDAQTTHGAFAGMGGLTTFPQVLGWDLAGTVVADRRRFRCAGPAPSNARRVHGCRLPGFGTHGRPRRARRGDRAR